MRGLNHKVTTMDGIKGVLVPGDNGDDPFDVQRRTGVRIEKDQEESVGSSGGEEDIAEDKFQQLQANRSGAYKHAAVGALQSVLDEMAMDSDERKEEGERRQRQKRKRKKAPAGTDRKRKATFFGGSASSGDSDGDEQRSNYTKVIKKTVGARNKKCDAASVSSVALDANSQVGALVALHADGGYVHGDGEGEGEGGDLKKAGRPKKDCLAMERILWKDCRNADEKSMFFCTNSDVQRRLLIRWAGIAKMKTTGPNQAENATFEGALKRIQIMESAIKMHRAWTHRSGDVTRAYAEFNHNWESLAQFAESPPTQKMHCFFVYDFRMQIQVSGSLVAMNPVVSTFVRPRVSLQLVKTGN